MLLLQHPASQLVPESSECVLLPQHPASQLAPESSEFAYGAQERDRYGAQRACAWLPAAA